MSINIAMDGPAGAGKSTLARRAASALGYIYVDTGALYRTVGLYALRKGLDTKDSAQVIPTLAEIDIRLGFRGTEQRVYLNGEDVSEEIRTPEASMGASDVSAIPEVRAFLFDLQKEIARTNDCLMDGRDIGTVVLPDAQVKIFITAAPEVRAQRRYDELLAKGMDVRYEDVLADIVQRDYQDSHREIAPLKAADDAILFDSGERSLDDNVAAIVDIIRQKLAQ